MNFLGIKFTDYGLVYFFKNLDPTIKKGDFVVVTTDDGMGLGKVVCIKDNPPEYIDEEEIKTIDRKATEEDLKKQEENKKLSREAFDYCKVNIENLGLDMKLVDVEVRFDRSKILFYFTAPCRVDFRELVKILVKKYRTRIELRQIGVRNEAQMVGGLGTCGRICCCRLFLKKFDPVTIKMAKEQQLFLNPSKISGTCGRLLCCLNFEKDLYDEFHEKCPKIGKKYETRLGEIRILRANIFRDSLVVDTGTGVEREITIAEWVDLIKGTGDLSQYEYLFSGKQLTELKSTFVSLDNLMSEEELEALKQISMREEYTFSLEEVSYIGKKQRKNSQKDSNKRKRKNGGEE